MENKISIQIPEEVKSQAEQLVNDLSLLLSPYLVALTPEQRQTCPKMGGKTLAFVEKAINYCEMKPNFTPPYLNVPELKKDFEAYRILLIVAQLVNPLASNLDDTLMLCGSEAYIASLSYYQSVKDAARRSTPDAKRIAEDLKSRFSMTVGSRGSGTEKQKDV